MWFKCPENLTTIDVVPEGEDGKKPPPKKKEVVIKVPGEPLLMCEDCGIRWRHCESRDAAWE